MRGYRNLVVPGVAGGAGGISAVNISAGTTSNNLTNLVFSNSNGISFGLNGSTITGTVQTNYLTSQSNQAFSADASSTFQTLTFQNSNGVSFSNNAGALRVTHDLMFSTSRPAFSADASSTFQTLTFQNSNQISFSNNAGAIRITHDLMQSTSRPAFSADASSTFQTLTFQNSNGFTFSNNAGAIRASYTVPVQSNGILDVSTGTASGTATSRFAMHDHAHRGIRGIAAVGTASTFFGDFNLSGGNGVTLITGGNSTAGSVGFSVANQTNQTLGLYMSSNTTSSVSSGTVDARSMTFRGVGVASVGYSGGEVVISVPAGGAGETISSYENMPLWGTSAVTFGATSLSSAVAFNMPQAGSFSFLRIPVLMTMGSTTIATVASATATAQMGQSSTWNAVVYSVGSGASSKSLMSVASGSNTWNLSARISISNSTQYSISLAFSGNVEGGGTTRTTQYSISNTNYSFTSQAFSEFSSNRFLDIAFANSLAAGPYWLVVGRSSSSSSAGIALSAMTSWGPRYSNHYAGTQGDLLFAVMGSTNQTSIGALIGAGVFSTAGGGTTANLPISAISSTASNPRMYFQMLRSA